MIRKIFMLCVILLTCSSCSEFALLASGSSLAISQNSYAKMYNGVDFLTVVGTEKSMKRHVYDNAKKAWAEAKEGKEYIYDKTWGFTD
jgi:predicted nucleic acid-binding protein